MSKNQVSDFVHKMGKLADEAPTPKGGNHQTVAERIRTFWKPFIDEHPVQAGDGGGGNGD